MKTFKLQISWLALLFASLLTSTAYGQITPSGDSYTNTADSTTNYGATTLLYVDGAKEITYIQFNLASIPSGASVSQATLKLFVNSVSTAGSFNVDYVNGTWSESTIDASNAPALGTTIASGVSVTTADKNQYILVNVTSAVQAWLSGSETNDGIALVANSTFNASFDSKENTTTSHPAELDIAYAGGDGTITGITTASDSGLTGGGTSGTLNLSLTNGCATSQVLEWNGSAWACSSSGTGTITGVTAGTDLTGGGTSGNVTLNLNTSQVPLLASNNAFIGNNSFSGTVGVGMTSPTRAFEVNAPGTTVAQMVMLTNGTDAALSLDNTASGGHEYWIDSGSGGAGVGAGNFAVWDNTVAAARLAINPSGNVGIGTTTPGAGLSMAGGLTISGTGYTQFSTQYQGTNSFALNADVASSGDGWTLYDYASGSWTGGITQEGGNVGIGTLPGGAALDVLAATEPAGYFETDAPDNGLTLAAINTAPASEDFAVSFVAGSSEPYGGGGNCYITQNGDLDCSGSKSAVVPVDGGSRRVALYAMESPENWFEDFGSGQLSNGSARIDLEATFAQTVNSDLDYHVFLTPNGDCKGLYVSQKSPTSFEVHELAGGTSSVAFDYRIIAKRKNYETVRLADLTERYKKLNENLAKMRQRRHVAVPAAMATQPHSLDPVKGTQAIPSATRPAQPGNHTVRATAPAIHP